MRTIKYPDPPPVVPDPESIDAQAVYRCRQSRSARRLLDSNMPVGQDEDAWWIMIEAEERGQEGLRGH